MAGAVSPSRGPQVQGEPAPPAVGRVVSLMAILLALIALAWAAELPYRLGFVLYPEQALAAILGLALSSLFLGVGARRQREGVPFYDRLAATLSVGVGAYVMVRYPVLADESFFRPTETMLVGLVLVVLMIEALRRSTGWSLLSVLLAFMAYCLLGHFIPGRLAGRPMEVLEMVRYLGIDNGAMLGLPLKVISTIVVTFIFMGQLLLRSGGSAFFSDLAAALMGRSRGGSGKVAVFASGLFGSISGSAVANVASTGVVTIPLMRQGGYRAHVSGAIEAVASTGGQLLPPVMGAAAFLMAELLGVSYGEVVLAALVPSVLYFLSVFVQADLEAARQGIGAMEEADIPALGRVLREGWYFPLPFVVLVVGLFNYNLTAETAGLYAAASVAAAGLVFSYRGSRLSPRDLLGSIQSTGLAAVQIVVIGAAAGMIMGIIDVTGLSFGLTFVLVEFGQSSLLLLLAATALVCIILGMGMPTTAIYFLLATLAAPPIIQLGVSPMAAHMFVLYLGCMSMITPPVALAAFTAANLAGADPMKTAATAVRLGWPGLVVPFLFVFGPTLLLEGTWLQIVPAVATALIGIWLVSVGIAGHLVRPLTAPVRLGLMAAGLALLVPAQAFGWAWLVELVGAALSVLLVLRELGRRGAG